MLKPKAAERPIIAPLLKRYDDTLELISLFHDQIQKAINSSQSLKPLIHSVRARIKDRDHFQDKLLRRLRNPENGEAFGITAENLHTEITDLAGIRILHLHTAQAKEIDTYLRALLVKCGYKFREGPEARTWDIEYEEIFKGMGFATKQSKTLYTSVHYVISDEIPNLVRTCELQVRTLAEEIWGEVSHKFTYPHQVSSVACNQQIKALARSTSAAGRLVDSIFSTVADEVSKKAKAKKRQAKKASSKKAKKKR
jgi:putative GTP pyrophosphokinase